MTYLDSKVSSSPLRRRLRRLSEAERAEEAVALIRQFHRETGRSDDARRKREAKVLRDLRRHGTYDHTPEELAFGARVAWRNHAQCIGRRFWESLKVVDCRDVRDPDDMARRMADHMVEAHGDGRIASVITVFPPARPDILPPYAESGQVIQYAGWQLDDGRVIGDRRNIEITRVATALGWEPRDGRGPFNVLPLILRDAQDRRRLYDLPEAAVREVAITHPDVPAIDALGLRWYAVPCITDMILTIGGLDYPCAPFNGFYMCTEIASRDFADETRYGALPDVARALGDDPGAKGPPLWKDRALTELNRAVLHSFDRAGVTMIDHHTASEQYMDFAAREHAQGREPSGDWNWLVPPQASAACPVFHVDMRDLKAVPNFYRSRATDGGPLGISRAEEETRGRILRWLHGGRRRYRDWRRARG